MTNTVLQLAQVLPTAQYVQAKGGDSGVYVRTQTPCDSYTKDIPIGKAMSDEVLLAFEMNGKPLLQQYGAPVRLIVPGFYGTNSVKWYPPY